MAKRPDKICQVLNGQNEPCLILLIIYFWPVPNKDSSQLSDKVDPQVRQFLLDFRAQRPEKTVTVDGRAWRYIAMGEGPDAILFCTA